MSSSTRKARWKDLTSIQRRSGLAAWSGWMFDGLDMHLYTLVAAPFVALLLAAPAGDPSIARHGAYINAGFLVGWACGGVVFGRLGDQMGRSRTLCLTILTYALFTGLSSLSTQWWHLLCFRFLSALGIGGEWAVGASLLSETWPKTWRPWMAAALQSAVNVGVLLACLAGFLLEGQGPRWLFLVGILPAGLVLWIRSEVPETNEWKRARQQNLGPAGVVQPSELPSLTALFRDPVSSVTWPVLALCAVALSGHWTFMFWQQAHLRSLAEVRPLTAAGQNHVVVIGVMWLMLGSVAGNFLAGALAQRWGYRWSALAMLLGYGATLVITFFRDWSLAENYGWFVLLGLWQGVFALFTMWLPPLFPVLLRTTGAGFCYNAGRLAAAGGTIYFGLFARVNDYRHVLLYTSLLFGAAAFILFWMPKDRVPAESHASD